jgi:hypothetical protein
LWNWLQLLIVPAVIAAGGLWFNAQQQEREQRIANERAQDQALQAYLNHMSQLLTDKEQPLARAQPGDSISKVAQVRTVTVLRMLDGKRKTSLLQFLYDLDLIDRDSVVVDLRGADLSEANLFMANLSEADLHGANWSGADLLDTDLSGANLHGANLRGAQNWTVEQLTTAKSLEEAIMPDGQILKGDRTPDGPTFEDWLKSKGRGEDKETSGLT